MAVGEMIDTIWYYMGPKMLHCILLYTQVGPQYIQQSEINVVFSLTPLHAFKRRQRSSTARERHRLCSNVEDGMVSQIWH